MDRIITALQLQKRNKQRVNVFLDGEYAFAIELMAAAALRKGQSLSEAEIARLREDDTLQVAYQRALSFLGYRPRSRVEVVQNLRAKGYDEAVIEQVVAQLVQQNYVDDAAFSQFWVENREQFRPRSARAIRHELQQKGVERSLIDDALANLDEDEAAWAAVEPKLARWQGLGEAAFEQKIAGFLARRGFSYDVVRRIARRAQTPDERDA